MSDRYDQIEAELFTMRRRMRRLAATNFLLAVVVFAFGGVGAAYALAAANSVNSASIIDGSIITPDLKTGALSGSKILDNAVTGADVNEATLVLTCPAATPTRIGSFCVGAQRPADDLMAAAFDCAGEGLRLPTFTEATSISSEVGIWTDILHHDGGFRGVAIRSTITQDPDVLTTANVAYRCVTDVGARP